MEQQRTLNLNGTMVYCYDDGSVEWLHKQGRGRHLRRSFGSVSNHGYMRIHINNKHYAVHRLICLAFHSNPNNLPEVDHINRNKLNNRPENLRWATRKDNQNNKAVVDDSMAKYGVRYCDDAKTYRKAYKKHCLQITKPDGTSSTTCALSQDVYDMLKPLSQRERYLKYRELKEASDRTI